MNSSPPDFVDRRQQLLLMQDVERWYKTPDGNYEVGLKGAGEFRMGAESGHIIIVTPANDDWMNFGRYRFYLPHWSGNWQKPKEWDNPFKFSDNGEFLTLHWLCYHVHAQIIPVIVHLKTKTFCLLESGRILIVNKIETNLGYPVAVCDETKWVGSLRHELTDVDVPISAEFRPIEEFYILDPISIETNVYNWEDGRLIITPLNKKESK